jgi:hypothetical protein
MSDKVWKFSRSHDLALLECPRKGYLKFYYGGTGIERVGLNLEQATGGLAASMLEMALTRVMKGKEIGEEIYELAIEEYKDEVNARGFGDLAGSVELEMERQSALAEGLVRAWLKVRLPRMLEDYELISVEEEREVDLGGGVVVMMCRADAEWRRKVDGVVYPMEFKTTGYMSTSYVEAYRYDIQTLTHILSAEQKWKCEVGGVLMEFLYKGYRNRDKETGDYVYHSPLLKAWTHVDEVTGEVEYTTEWEVGRRKGWVKFDPMAMGMKRWVDVLSVSERGELEGMLFHLPVQRSEKEMREWQEQMVLRQMDVREGIEKLNSEPAENVADYLMRKYFPARYGRDCYDNKYHKSCEFLDVCYGRIDSPLESGRFVARKPHHPGEGGEGEEG